MINALNLCTLLERYCYSKKLSENELDYLERCWVESLNNLKYNRFPSIAPAIVCDEAGLERGSFWISCNASILDKLRPMDSNLSRSERIFNVLFQSGLIAA